MPVKTYPQAMVAFGSLVDDPANPRSIPEQALTRLKNSIKEFGFVEPVVARFENNLVVGGHQRRAAFKSLMSEEGYSDADIDKMQIPVVLVKGITEAKAKALNLALNKVSGEWDYEKLSSVLQDLTNSLTPEEVDLSGFGSVEVSDILGLVSSSTTALDDLGQGAKEGPTVVMSTNLLECPACHHTWSK